MIHQPGQQISPQSVLVLASRPHIPEREHPHQVIVQYLLHWRAVGNGGAVLPAEENPVINRI